MKKFKIQPTPHIYAGRAVYEIRAMLNPPTYEEAVAALEQAEAARRPKHIIAAVSAQVRWEYGAVNNLSGNWTAFCRCECGEIAFCGETCQTCRLLASLLLESPTSGPLQVRYERAERALGRLVPVLERLQREAKGEAA